MCSSMQAFPRPDQSLLSVTAAAVDTAPVVAPPAAVARMFAEVVPHASGRDRYIFV